MGVCSAKISAGLFENSRDSRAKIATSVDAFLGRLYIKSPYGCCDFLLVIWPCQPKKTSRGMDSGASDSPILFKYYRINGVMRYGLHGRLLHRFSKFCVDCSARNALYFFILIDKMGGRLF